MTDSDGVNQDAVGRTLLMPPSVSKEPQEMSKRQPVFSKVPLSATVPEATARANSESTIESIVETLREPLLVLDDELFVVSANRAFCETFDVAPEATSGHSLFQVGDGQGDTPELRRLLDRLVRDRVSFHGYDIGRTFSRIGNRTMRLDARPLRHPMNHPNVDKSRIGTLLLSIEDVTVQQRALETMTQSETRYRRLFEAARDGILLLDVDSGAITDANPFMAELLGYTHEELIGLELWQIGLFADQDASRAAFLILQEKGYIRYEDPPLQTRRGERRDVEVVSNVYAEGSRKVIQCNIRDITERKRQERALHHSETRYRRLFEEAQDGIALLDVDTGRITDGNPRLCELLGCTHAELIDKELWEVGLLADKEISQATVQELLENGYIRYEDLPLLTRGGDRRQIKFTSNVYIEDGRRVIHCNIRDITERKRTEKALAVVMARDHHIAETLQRPLTVVVPEDAFPGLLIATLYAPASSEALVGGDFHDAFAIPGGRVALAVADTLGKGLFAAARTMQIKDVLRAFARESPASLTEVVARVNRFACNTQRFDDSGDGMFTCLVIAFLDPATGEGEIVFAGCEPPVILRSLSDVEYLPMENACLPLGITVEASYMSVPLHLKIGETLIFMTDGITEARALKTREYPGIRFLETTGAVALAQQVRETHTLRGMGEAILEGARAFASGALHDDACVLLARLRTA